MENSGKNYQLNALINSELGDQIVAEAKKRQTTRTQIVIDALNLYFEKFNHMELTDSITQKVIDDKSSIMIPKDLYMKLFGFSEKELENYIQKNKVETALLNINNEEKISYIKQKLDEKKSIFKILIKNQHEIESLRFTTIENNQKISKMEENFQKIYQKIEEKKSE